MPQTWPIEHAHTVPRLRAWNSNWFSQQCQKLNFVWGYIYYSYRIHTNEGGKNFLRCFFVPFSIRMAVELGKFIFHFSDSRGKILTSRTENNFSRLFRIFFCLTWMCQNKKNSHDKKKLFLSLSHKYFHKNFSRLAYLILC